MVALHCDLTPVVDDREDYERVVGFLSEDDRGSAEEDDFSKLKFVETI